MARLYVRLKPDTTTGLKPCATAAAGRSGRFMTGEYAGIYVLLGGIALFAVTIATLDWLGRRQHRRVHEIRVHEILDTSSCCLLTSDFQRQVRCCQPR